MIKYFDVSNLLYVHDLLRIIIKIKQAFASIVSNNRHQCFDFYLLGDLMNYADNFIKKEQNKE